MAKPPKSGRPRRVLQGLILCCDPVPKALLWAFALRPFGLGNRVFLFVRLQGKLALPRNSSCSPSQRN